MKLTIIGKGSVGSLAVMQFLHNTDWEIEGVFDENIPVASVGEASNLQLPNVLTELGGNHDSLLKMKGTVKQGIYKKNWSSKPFIHPFKIGSIGIHFQANALHDSIFQKVKNNPRVKIFYTNIEDPNTVDSDYVLVCTGTPAHLEEENYIKLESVPVNAAHIQQSPGETPRFTYSLTNAMQYGGVFGIPLQNRISIGYLYNDRINNVEDIKKDIKKVFKEYNLNDSDKILDLKFKSYYRKNNFSSKVIYNGNASFFIEPLEATSIAIALDINKLAYLTWTKRITENQSQKEYEKTIKNIESMISLHYLSGSIYKTKFGEEAYQRAEKKLKQEFAQETDGSNFLWSAAVKKISLDYEMGAGPDESYRINVEGLQIKDKIIKIRNSTKSITK